MYRFFTKTRLSILLLFASFCSTSAQSYLDQQWYERTCALSAASVQTNTAKMALYPDPASEYLHVEALQKSSEVVVYNEIGQVLYRRAETALKYDIDVREWAAGIYVVEVRSDVGSAREKVTVL